MSALDGWIDVCRVGTWRDSANRDVVITEATLDGIVAAYDSADPAPVVVGHPATDAPAYGWVAALRRTGDRLQAKLRDIAPAFRQAVEGGHYAGRSIATNRAGLRHLAFLGGRQPAVPGLAPTQFSGGEAEQEIAFAVTSGGELAEPRYAMGFRAMADLARAMRDRLIETDGMETADRVFPSWQIDQIERAASEDDGMFAGPAPSPRDRELAKRERAVDLSERRIQAGEALEAHIRAGRVLPAERDLVVALAAELERAGGTLEFASAGETRTEAPATAFQRFLAGLPVRVNYTALAAGPIPGARSAGNSRDEIERDVEEAQKLIALAASRGETLSAAEAVAKVEAGETAP